MRTGDERDAQPDVSASAASKIGHLVIMFSAPKRVDLLRL